MATFVITAPDGAKYSVNAPDGATEQDAIDYVQKNLYKPSAVKSAGSMLNQIPRQLGLTARDAIESLGQAVEIGSEPIRYATDRLTGYTGKTKPASMLAADLADKIGLPKPETDIERVANEGAKLGFSSMAFSGAAKKLAEYAPAAIEKSLSFLAANPAQQAVVAAGAGTAGSAAKEADGTAGQQVMAALAGGLGAGGAYSLAKSGVNAVRAAVSSKLLPQELDIKIGDILKSVGVNYDELSNSAKVALRSDVASALNTGAGVNPQAVARLAAFRQAGVTPTRGMISQNPVQITKEMNLAKLGANSSDDGLHGLALLQNQNNSKLIENLNGLGAAVGDVEGAGSRLSSSITGTRDALRSQEQSLWDAAKASPGYTMPVGAGVLSDVNAALHSEGMMPFLNPTISAYIEAFQKGVPFTPQHYRNLLSMLAREEAKGGNEAYAASLAKRILVERGLSPAGFASQSGSLVTAPMAAGMRAADGAVDDAVSAVNRARNATRAAYTFEDSSPMVRQALSDTASADPARLAQRFIVNGTANEAAEMMQHVGPRGAQQVRAAVVAHLKSVALNSAADETGKFSQAAFNKALSKMGERKLALIFTPEELAALRNNGRVASLMMSQPVGAAVNNSNSGAMLGGMSYDALRALASKFPLGQQLVLDPAKSIAVSIGSRAAKNVAPGLLNPTESLPAWQPALAPAALGVGLLAAP